LPEEEFVELKSSANLFIYSFINLTKVFEDIYKTLEISLNELKNTNFTEEYPEINFNELLPQLKIGEDGFPGFDVEEVLNGFDYNIEHYKDDEFQDLFPHFLSSNEEFDLYEISIVMSSLMAEKYNGNFEFGDDENYTEYPSAISMDQEFDGFEEYPSPFSMDQGYGGFEEYPSSSMYQVFDDFENPSDTITELNPDEIKSRGQVNIPEFKTKNATMVVEINGKQNSFDKVTFSLGGDYSRYYAKPGFNLKIRGDKDLYGRKQFKLRSDSNEPTFLRTKLVSDIHNRLGLLSVSASYAELYINDEYMGLFVISDAYKKSWVEYVYDEENTSLLYKCEIMEKLAVENSEGCINENDDVTDHSEWISFLSAVENAKSSSDLEDIFEIDHFLKEMALDYLLGSWDHITNYHNYYMYKQPNGKWIYLSQDFDHDFGQPNLPINTSYTDFFKRGLNSLHLFEVLILGEPQRFEKVLNEIVMDTFNPSTLYSRIDELKQFIRPYVEKEKTPDSDGKYPGRINDLGKEKNYSIEQWDAYSEFTTSMTDTVAFGLKYWILMKYRYVCNTYNMECDPTYLDESYEYPINKELEFDLKGSIYNFLLGSEEADPSETTTNVISTKTSVPTKTSTVTEDNEYKTTSIVSDIIAETMTSSITGATPSTPTFAQISEAPVEKLYQCWSELKGYSCCSDGITRVYAQDDYGDWGYDFKKQMWCGLTPYEERSFNSDECWSEALGYSCCKGCQVYEIDSNGSWGYELHQWCGIPSYCQK